MPGLHLSPRLLPIVFIGVVAATLHQDPPEPKPKRPVIEQHRVLLQGEGRLAIVGPGGPGGNGGLGGDGGNGGASEWEMPWGAIHDLHRLANGHIMVQQDFQKIVEIDPVTKGVVWEYDASKENGNAGRSVEVHSFQPLADGLLLIAESGPARLLEIDRNGIVHREIALVVNHPDAHRDTRLVRKLASGNYLVCHEGDGCVREYDGSSGKVVWDYSVPLFGQERKEGHGPEAFGNQVFAALRLPTGNTLITTGNGHALLEVDAAGKTVWELHQHDLPGITLAWVTTLEVLANGDYVFGNCHAGKGQPLLIEIEPKTKRVVWTLDAFDPFGNSVSNSLLLDGKSLR